MISKKIKVSFLVTSLFFCGMVAFYRENRASLHFDLVYNTDFVPFIRSNLNDFTGLFLIDTGSCSNVKLESAILEKMSPLEYVTEISTRYYKGDIITSSEYKIEKPNFLGIKAKHLYVKSLSSMHDSAATLEKESHGYKNSPFKLSGLSFNESKPDEASIGLYFLQNFNVLMDFKNHSLSLYKKGATPLFRFPYGFLTSSKKFPLSYEEDSGIICLFDTPLGKKRFLLDSGAGTSVIYEKKDPTKEDSSDYYKTLTLDSFSLNQVQFGPITLDILSVDYSPPYDGILGTNFFYNKKIYIDFENQFLSIL
jgi:hypothetical protein